MSTTCLVTNEYICGLITLHMLTYVKISFLIILATQTQCDDFQDVLGHIKSSTNASIQKKATEELIQRIIPGRASDFLIEIDPTIGPEGKDTFQLLKVSTGHVKIVGTSGVAAASGFHAYLKYYCDAHVSWEGVQLNLPDDLPDVNDNQTSNDRFRYYQNVCTTSYSFVWWDWKQWEKHIDWMALNSFNLVLAFNGQEAIWERVYLSLNLTQEEIDEHFAGPAFLSWSRMGNIRGWGGPLSKAWHLRSLNLQKQILQRMRELGIVPVLPAFAGHVPRAIKRLYPNASTIKLETWNKFNDTFCCPLLLNPTEKLFKTIGNLFIKELISEFGTDHVYNCDTFNEMKPFTANLTYLNAIGKSIFSAMTDIDPQAVWLLQGWMFYSEIDYWKSELVQGFMRSVPLGRMIVLDLQSEQFPQYNRLKSYFGQPFIWCMLHNFGGTLGMFGSVDIINQRPFLARNMENSTMIGTGLTPEGINQNYVVYDLMSEMAWRSESANLTEWFASYSTRRYGIREEHVVNAWQLLKAGVYNFNGITRIRGKYAVTRSPRTRIKTYQWYPTGDLLNAWDMFLNASEKFRNSFTYRHDLVDITRQVLQVLGDEHYNKFIAAFRRKDVKSFQTNMSAFLQILADLERILGSNQAFLLAPWLNDAKKAASNEKEEKLFEFVAKNQITLWGPKGEIQDYANKQWSGLVSDYFFPRWLIFLKKMNESLTTGKVFQESKIVRKNFIQIEKPFTFDRRAYPSLPQGDSIEIAKNIHDNWKIKYIDYIV